MNLEAVLEGLLFVVGDEGLTFKQIQEILEVNPEQANEIINKLKQRYNDPEFGLDIKILGDRLKMTTKKEHKEYLQKLIDVSESEGLSESALETLAIIAYNQPVTRLDVDEIRGVSSAHMIRKLNYKNLIEEVGRAESAGRPILYATTPLFLDYFGLKSISDLPPIVEKEEDSEMDLYNSKYVENE